MDTAVTGAGVVSPAGDSLPAAWITVLSAKACSAPLTLFDARRFPFGTACEVQEIDRSGVLSAAERRRWPRVLQMAAVAARLAVEDSGLEPESLPSARGGVVVGTCMGGMSGAEDQGRILYTKGPGRINPFLAALAIPNAIPAAIAMDYHWTGPNSCVSTACAAGAHAIAEADRWIRDGRADVVIAGGCDAMVSPFPMAAFWRIGTLSPSGTSRPFSEERDGFVIGEGATFVVLEARDHAEARGATVLGTVTGTAINTDAYHPSDPHPDGAGAEACMRAALANAALPPEAIVSVNAHGTATVANDRAEARAVASVFGRRAIPVTANKSVTGHMIGASGAFEFVMALCSSAVGAVPPISAAIPPDGALEELVDVVAGNCRRVRCGPVLSNSFALGGQNCCIIAEGSPALSQRV